MIASKNQRLEYSLTIPLQYTYDSNNNQLTYKDSNGYWVERTYNSNRNILTSKDSDGAWYENASVNTYFNDMPYSFGAGISFETKAGIFSLNYALGKQFSNPIDLRSGKIHFGIVNQF